MWRGTLRREKAHEVTSERIQILSIWNTEVQIGITIRSFYAHRVISGKVQFILDQRSWTSLSYTLPLKIPVCSKKGENIVPLTLPVPNLGSRPVCRPYMLLSQIKLCSQSPALTVAKVQSKNSFVAAGKNGENLDSIHQDTLVYISYPESTSWEFKLHWKKSSTKKLNLTPCINTQGRKLPICTVSPAGRGLLENGMFLLILLQWYSSRH